MGLPENIRADSQSYYDSLRDLRDSAVVESNWLGRRRRIGAFSFGMVEAMWRAEDGGLAILKDKGPRLGKLSVSSYPTSLHLYSDVYENGGVELIRFKMELDDVGMVRVNHSMLTKMRVTELFRADLGAVMDSRRNLDWPSDDDFHLLYDELERGASGVYSFSLSSEPE